MVSLSLRLHCKCLWLAETKHVQQHMRISPQVTQKRQKGRWRINLRAKEWHLACEVQRTDGEKIRGIYSSGKKTWKWWFVSRVGTSFLHWVERRYLDLLGWLRQEQSVELMRWERQELGFYSDVFHWLVEGFPLYLEYIQSLHHGLHSLPCCVCYLPPAFLLLMDNDLAVTAEHMKPGTSPLCGTSFTEHFTWFSLSCHLQITLSH